MKRTVVKFGGSSLKSKEDITRIIEVVRHYETRPVIVVSALFGVTDLISATIARVRSSQAAIDELVGTLRSKYSAMAKQFISEWSKLSAFNDILDERLNQMDRLLLGMHFLSETPDFATDSVLSFGERLSSALLSAIFNNAGIDCAEALPEDVGLITDGRFRQASVDLEASETGILKALSADKVYVIPGFYGISKEGKITLLGRGGSDYSAASIGRCIGATSVDLWKDVPGFLSADPKLVKNTVAVEKLTYSEAAELSYFGARILHPQTVEPLIDRSIPLRLFNICDFTGEIKPCSIIGTESFVTDDIVKSVTYSDDLGILRLIGPGVGIKPGVLAFATEKLSGAGINIKSVITAQTTINILLSRNDLEKCRAMFPKPEIPAVDEIEFNGDISLIAVVGEGMLARYGIAARVFGAVSSSRINILLISMGASPAAAYFIVKADDREEAVKAIHNEFFSNSNK